MMDQQPSSPRRQHNRQTSARLSSFGAALGFLKERFARNGAIVRLLNKCPNPPNKDVGEGLNTAFEKMHQLGLREPDIEGLDSDVLVSVRHSPLASPEQTIKNYLETNKTIRNKKAREITHIKDSDHMEQIIEGNVGTRRNYADAGCKVRRHELSEKTEVTCLNSH